MSVRNSPYAFPAEIARYLAIDAEQLKDLIKSEEIPTTQFPSRTREVQRIYLPDFHGWLLKRTKNPGPQLKNYQKFLSDFEICRIERKNSAA